MGNTISVLKEFSEPNARHGVSPDEVEEVIALAGIMHEETIHPHPGPLPPEGEGVILIPSPRRGEG